MESRRERKREKAKAMLSTNKVKGFTLLERKKSSKEKTLQPHRHARGGSPRVETATCCPQEQAQMLLVPPPDPQRGSRPPPDGAAAKEKGRLLLDGVGILVAAKLIFFSVSISSSFRNRPRRALAAAPARRAHRRLRGERQGRKRIESEGEKSVGDETERTRTAKKGVDKFIFVRLIEKNFFEKKYQPTKNIFSPAPLHRLHGPPPHLLLPRRRA